MPAPVIAAVAALAPVVIGAVQAGAAAKKKREEEKKLEALKQPFYKVQSELLQNRNIAANNAQMGVPQATMDYMTAENQRGVGTSLATLRQTGGSANNVSELFAAYQRGNQSIGAMDANQRLANLSQFMQENQQIAGQKTMKWAINEFQPFQNKVQAYQQNIAASNQNISNGLNSVIGGAAAYGTAMQNQDLINSLNNMGQQQPAPMSYQQVQSGVDQYGLSLARQNLPQVPNPTTMPNGQVQPTPFFAAQRQAQQPDYANRWNQYLPQ
jgi:ABC-type Fe3+-citrate transport system substrate-binding protein